MKRGDGSKLKVLVLEPYCGGSHESFLKSLLQLPFEFDLMTLPARRWKWRMRLSSPYFAGKLREEGVRCDRILCSSFVDVAAFRGMAPSWVREVPLLTYFHENQFSYPVQVEDERDLHFSVTNMTTALASDCLAFNSSHNLQTFLTGIESLLKNSYDLKLDNALSTIRAKSAVLYPAIDFSSIDSADMPDRGGCPVILWNHRWEFDKNPELFFSTLFALDRQGIDFRLIVLGQSFERCPPVFREAGKRLAHKILHFGYAEDRGDYARLLKQGDIVVSTASHEFFGMAVLEAVRAGCRPLLPERLSYPELFPREFLYRDGDFSDRLRQELTRNTRLTRAQSRELTDRYCLEALLPLYRDWITEAGCARE